MLGTLIVSLSFLQLGVIVGGFAIIYHRLNAVRNELEEIKRTLAKIGKQIDLTVDARFFAALELLNKMQEMQDPCNRQRSAAQALNSFLEVEDYYRNRLEMELQEGWMVAPLLKMLILAQVGAMLCYLALGENTCAWKHLAEKRERVTQPYLERWYDMVVGVEPALVLHPETGISLRRLTMLMCWRTPDLTREKASENLSADIWRVARESIKPEKFPPSLRDDPEKAPMKRLLDRDRDHRFLKGLGMAFEQIETLYGAVRCLEGYQIELEQMNRLGMSPDRILPASLSTDALVVCVPRDSELLS